MAKRKKKSKKKTQKIEKESLLWTAESNIGFMWAVPWLVLVLIFMIIGSIT